MLDSPEARFAVDVVREAALLVRRIQRELVTAALTKDDRSPVTVADFVAQAIVAHALAERFPQAVLVGEEQADMLRSESGAATLAPVAQFVRTVIPAATLQDVCDWIDRGGAQPADEFWTLDPVDGTKGFLRHEQYAVALAFIRNGRVELGVLGCPELGDGETRVLSGAGSLVAAATGQGTWARALDGRGDWRRLNVSPRSRPAEARLLRSVEKAHTNTDEIGQLVTHLGIEADPVALDSQVKYAVLAAGGGDVLLRLISPKAPGYKERIWDQAAGSIVIEEALGKVTDLDGRALDFSHGRTLAKNRGILATNGHLHDAMLAGLRAVGA